ncbi:MAG: 50S ribosomal protein L9 [Candidatus Rokubacteria bacterium GWC2_70_24]|nr:MAG: 50S ribosomal protein L9 [Candidatus Rokubacteria bacterium GWA2_70_23]OGK88269.1 MAG: 50S ribosomal protein L9 [Candidatus Rokubacteria bacterium GWC2_70_24]OGK92769.1 MAG: 50S ribosomal protein L9 [Candidatus Rokubacteria bacterium GWF2_70_14]HAM41605.1 50S ribosomal protein L9 [Candidatus Omnitrophota bacterium]
MKIILLDDVATLGRRGEVRDVSDGYARNYLLPQKLALNATAANLKNLDTIKARHEGQAATLRAEAETQALAIEALAFTQSRQASDEGRLFGSVGKADVAAFLAQHGIEIERRRIALEEPIKALGEFRVPIRLHGDVTAHLKVAVSRE